MADTSRLKNIKKNSESYSNSNKSDNPQKSKILILSDRLKKIYHYCATGVWRDPRDTIRVRIIKTLNLVVRSFFDRGLQLKSMSLTYSTVLAIVPALALIFAICRGFGLQDVLTTTLPKYFPAQTHTIDLVFGFVDNTLRQASSGIFVGVGIVMLLWTIISLLSNIENAFNNIWDVRIQRSMYQKVTDYIAICLMVPILLICASGVSIFMSTTLQDKLNLPFLTPVFNVIMEAAPLFLIWIAFSLSFLLIPNTKVNIKYAVISGFICAIAFYILQLLFVNGQIYVSKYNAIYGSFSLLPIILVGLQLSWLILLFGCVLTFSMQNIFSYNYLGDVMSISDTYKDKITLVIASVIFQNFYYHHRPYTRTEISRLYNIPIRITGNICNKLLKAGLIYHVQLDDDKIGLSPAVDADTFSVKQLFVRLLNTGEKDFIPGFDEAFKTIYDDVDSWIFSALEPLSNVKLIDLPLPTPDEIAELLEKDRELYNNELI